MLESLFDRQSVNAILQISIPIHPRPDKLVWIPEPKGQFTVKSTVKIQNPPTDDLNILVPWNKFWKLQIHERLKMFLWRIRTDVIPTNLNVLKRVGFGNAVCPLCNNEDESIVHLFFKCPAAKAIWFSNY